MDTVSVAVRVRPLVTSESNRGCKNIVAKPNNSAQIIINNSKQDVFTFNYAFSEDDSQEMVFTNAVKPIVKRIFEGYNATILAYGQTGSGKTHTMGTTFDGTENEDIGVIPRAVSEIFDTIDNMSDYNCSVSCSFMELYQEQLYDLLATNSREQNIVDIREDNIRGIFVSNLLEVQVGSVGEAIQCLIKGSAGRAVGATAMNATSSRSHAIFTINIQKTNIRNSGDSTSAKFHLVDLAGSERSKKTKATGCRFKEGVKINQGLLALGNVISALGTAGISPFISYRDSKLTRLLQDSLGGNSVTLMIACISPADYNFEETLSTLRYADRARKIKNQPIVNFDPKTAEINRLNAKIQELRMKLLNRNDPDWRKADEEYLSNELLRNEKQVELDLVKERLNSVNILFKEMSKKYEININDITTLNLKLGILESSHDEVLTKMKSVQSQITDIGLFFGSDGPLDITAGRAIAAELQEGVADVMKHLKQSIFDSSVVSSDFISHDSDDNECRAQSEVFQKQQIGYQENLREIQKELATKTMLHDRLNDNFENYCALEEGISKATENTSQYEAVIRKLELEKEGLKKIVDSKNTVNSKKLSEDRRKRVHELELEIAGMKKKIVRQEALLKQREKDRIKIADMQRDIHIIKQKKVQLIRAMRLESEAFRKWKLSSSKEVTRLQEKDRRRDGEMRKKQELHERQKNALKRKVEEALQSNKRLQESLQKNTIAQAQRSRTSASEGVRSQFIYNWLENEIEVFFSAVKAKHSLELLIDDRGEMNMRLLRMKKNKSRGIDDQEMTNLQEEIEMRTAQIADLQDKIKSSDLENKVKTICNSLNSIPEAKIVVRYLLDNLMDLRRQFELKAMQLTDIRIAQGTFEQQLSSNDADWNERYDTISKEFEQMKQDRIQLESEYEEKVTILLQELQTSGKCMQNEGNILRIFQETVASFRNKTMEYESWMQENNAKVINGKKIDPVYSSDEQDECFGKQKTPFYSSDECDEDFKIPQIPAAKKFQITGPELNRTALLNTTVTLNETLPLNETVTLNSIFSDTTSNNMSYKRLSDDNRTDLQCSKLQKLSESELINMTITQYPYNEQKKRKPLLDLVL